MMNKEEQEASTSLHESSLGVSNNDEETGTVDDAKALRDTVIKSEEKAVKKARILVGLASLACAIAVTVTVFIITRLNDQQSFELEYEGFARDIKALVHWEIRYNFALMEQLSASITLNAGYLKSTFPFHTESGFEISGGFVDGMGGLMSAGFAPLVSWEQREDWERYSIANQGWIEKSAILKAAHPVHRDALHGTIQDHEHDRRLQVEKESVSPFIYRWDNGVKVLESEFEELMAPMWQVSPADYGVVNANLLGDERIAKLYNTVVKTKKGVLSEGYQVTDLFDFLFDPEEKHMKSDPHAILVEPVFSTIDTIENSTLIGLAVGITPYGNLFDRLLPASKDGVIAVLKNDCGDLMTFELTATKAIFLGFDDLHDSAFDKYVQMEPNMEMYEDHVLEEGVCTHDLFLYPSSKLREEYDTNRPLLYTCLVAIAFTITTGLLFMYDFSVTRRQEKTIQTALRTQSIVTSLFPKEVGRKIIEEAQNAPDKLSKDGQQTEQEKGAEQDALAQLYPEATVMFADLVGFTQWSSSRTPEEVFHLLRTIYTAFDNVAKRRRVYKVETIGDCYLAVCGLPQPRKDHYVAMARFSHECVLQMQALMPQLVQDLGEETAKLGVRVGLHSGPITAGVLRTDRARFQLFGDTVNTAARIETTGAWNKIHISEVTAELLKAAGKGRWVNKREDKVSAKGKGELQTYWLDMASENYRRSSTGTSMSTSSADGSIVTEDA